MDISHEFKERINEILCLQQKCHGIISNNKYNLQTRQPRTP